MIERKDITRMAREAGFVGFDGDNGSLRRFAALVEAKAAAAEREACAEVCEGVDFKDVQDTVEYAHVFAAAIRARGGLTAPSATSRYEKIPEQGK